MPRLYDLMLLIDASLPEDRRHEIATEVRELVESGGTVVAAHEWGARKISFEIDHRPEAQYELLQIEADNALLDRLNHNLKIMDGLLRFRIIRQHPGSPPVPPPPEPIGLRREEEADSRVSARSAADAPADLAE